jgi:hypothetical protein
MYGAASWWYIGLHGSLSIKPLAVCSGVQQILTVKVSISNSIYRSTLNQYRRGRISNSLASSGSTLLPVRLSQSRINTNSTYSQRTLSFVKSHC